MLWLILSYCYPRQELACVHVYVVGDADENKALSIINNAKTSRHLSAMLWKFCWFNRRQGSKSFLLAWNKFYLQIENWSTEPIQFRG